MTSQLGYELPASDASDRLRRILSRSDQRLLIAEVDGAVVGWVHAAIFEFLESEAFVLIGGLVVDARHRRRGIARLLIGHVEGWARSQGCFIVRLSSSVTRTGAHRFYGRLGYKNIKTQYAFIKVLDGPRSDDIRRFVPRVD